MEEIYIESMKKEIRDMKQKANILLVHHAISTEQHYRLCKELQDISDAMDK